MDKICKLERPSPYDYHFAAIYAFKGDSVRALEHLRIYDEKVLDPNIRMYPISFAQYDVLFENIWDNEEFKKLMKNDSAKNKEISLQLKN